MIFDVAVEKQRKSMYIFFSIFRSPAFGFSMTVPPLQIMPVHP